MAVRAVLRAASRALRGGVAVGLLVGGLAFAAGSALTVMSAGLFAGMSTLVARAGLPVPGPAVRYRGSVTPLRQAVADTTRRVSARTARGAARSVASAAGQAAPFIGAAVVVGVTAWELHDACETMRDLRALEAALGVGDGAQRGVCGPEPAPVPGLAEAGAGDMR